MTKSYSRRSLPPIILYRGPSQIDGKPIVALVSVASRNAKTGPMLQTWIHVDRTRSGDRRSPHALRVAGLDSSVCGSCPRRPVLAKGTGIASCYVAAHHFGAVRKWQRDKRNARPWNHPEILPILAREAAEHGLRVGSYGDPAAVPHAVWDALISRLRPRVLTGYTHQWRAMSGERLAWFRQSIMASADSAHEAEAARAAGWRYFAALPADAPTPDRTVICPATRPGSEIQCVDCGACDGHRTRHDRVSIALSEHGPGAAAAARARRSAALRVIQ